MEDPEEKCILTTRLGRKQSEQATNDVKSTGRRLHFCKFGNPVWMMPIRLHLCYTYQISTAAAAGRKGAYIHDVEEIYI